MKRTLMTLAAAAGLALPLGFAALGPASAQDGGNCLSGREIQQAIASGEVITVNEAMSAQGFENPPLRADLCESNGNLEWHVNIMDANGESGTKVLNAQGN